MMRQLKWKKGLNSSFQEIKQSPRGSSGEFPLLPWRLKILFKERDRDARVLHKILVALISMNSIDV